MPIQPRFDLFVLPESVAFSTLILLVGWQEGHWVCKTLHGSLYNDFSTVFSLAGHCFAFLMFLFPEEALFFVQRIDSVL